LAPALVAPTTQIVERPSPTVTWHAFDLKTGSRGSQLVTQQLGTFGRIIGEVTECNLDVRVYDAMLDDPALHTITYPTTAGLIPGALAGTLPGRSLLVALNEAEQPIWGGMAITRDRTANEWVNVSAYTLEHYLGRRFVGDMSFTDVDQAQIVAGIIDGIAVDGIGLVIDAPDSGQLRWGDYLDSDDKTALSALQDLMGLDGGPEFTVDLEWTDDDRTRLQYVFRCRTRLGSAPTAPVEFTMPGCVTDLSVTEDYTEGNGANDVLATSSGQGADRLTSDHHVAQDLLDGGWVRYDYRYQPAASVDDLQTLDDHATEQLAMMQDGLNEFSLVANLDQAPRLDQDWHLGDDITASFTCPSFPASTGPDGDLVPGFSGRARVVGWEANYDERTITPKVRTV
jgi:hypothetical protein